MGTLRHSRDPSPHKTRLRMTDLKRNYQPKQRLVETISPSSLFLHNWKSSAIGQNVVKSPAPRKTALRLPLTSPAFHHARQILRTRSVQNDFAQTIFRFQFRDSLCHDVRGCVPRG